MEIYRYMNINNLETLEEHLKHNQLCIYLCFFFLFMPTPATHGSPQARGPIRVETAGLCQSHSNTRSALPLKPMRQLEAMLDP